MIFWQRLRRHGQIRIKYHQHVAGRGGKTLAHRVALALALLLQHLDVPAVLVGVANAFAFGKGAVAGIAFDKQYLLRRSESRHPQDRTLDISSLVAARNEDAGGEFALREMTNRPADDVGAQAQLPDAGQWRDVSIDERSKSEPAHRQQLPLLLPDHLEIGEIHQIEEVGG